MNKRMMVVLVLALMNLFSNPAAQAQVIDITHRIYDMSCFPVVNVGLPENVFNYVPSRAPGEAAYIGFYDTEYAWIKPSFYQINQITYDSGTGAYSFRVATNNGPGVFWFYAKTGKGGFQIPGAPGFALQGCAVRGNW
jgi:hypothetical protein